MGTRVIIEWAGLEETISNLSRIEQQAPQNLERQTRALASATEQVWQQNTHVRSGQLRGGEHAEVNGLSFTLNSPTRYYDWVNDGHRTPRGWRTRHGYRPAKHQSYVKGQEMTQKAVDFVKQNIGDYLSKFLD